MANTREPGLVITPPTVRFKSRDDVRPTIFLAGSIEMGKAADWQTIACDHLTDFASIIYNPRRPDWDSSWEQCIESPQFNAQVNWELDRINAADIVVFVFDPDTKSPVTLLELGIVAASKAKSAFVCCPNGFWRKGNVDILCEREGINTYETVDDLLKDVVWEVRKKHEKRVISSHEHTERLAVRTALREAKAAEALRDKFYATRDQMREADIARNAANTGGTAG